MGDDWKSAGVAKMVVQRLLLISVKIENRKVMEALTSLRGWEEGLAFTGVSSSVRDKTRPILDTAMSFLKGEPPDTDLALGRLDEALGLWR